MAISRGKKYTKTDIHSVTVKHSFTNLILSYNEWTIDVIYADEPASVYKYTLKNNEIIKTGVSGTNNKENLKH